MRLSHRAILLSSLVVIFHSTVRAASVLSTSMVNPAGIAATLDVACEKAAEVFEKETKKVFSDFPYLRDVRSMHQTDWKEDVKSDSLVTSSKIFYLSVAPTMVREFPMMFLPADVVRIVCAKRPDGSLVSSDCTGAQSYSVIGSKALLYQKAVEATVGQNFLKSFRVELRFSGNSATSCTFGSNLYIDDNSYLWLKRHMVGNQDPSLVEAKIRSKFVDWSKSILPKLEAKK